MARVEGIVLEAQYRCRAGYLVVTSDGNPFEELLHFYLVGNKNEILDDLSLGRMYNPGIFRDVTIVPGAEAFEFTFFGDDRWRLSILDPPRRALLPRVFSNVRRSRSWLTPSYLDLRRGPHGHGPRR